MNTIERIHVDCHSRNKNMYSLNAQAPPSYQLLVDSNEFNDEIKVSSIKLLTSYWESIFESIRLTNGYWRRILVTLGLLQPDF
jgi:hypothetical protein